MKSVRRLSFIVYLIGYFICSTTCFAIDLPQRISFQNILANKEIVVGSVETIFQDSTGFMWFGGSNTLLRYDGSEFRQYYVSDAHGKPDLSTPLSKVKNIFEDRHHNLWFCTTYGLFRMVPSTETLIKIPDEGFQVSRNYNGVFDVHELTNGDILAYTEQGLFLLNPNTFVTTKFEISSEGNQLHQQIKFTSGLMNGDVELWLGSNLGIVKVDLPSKTFKLIKADTEHPELEAENYVNGITSDGDGNLWVATKNGLVYFDPQTQKSIRYINDPNNRRSIGGNDIYKIIVDTQGVVWIASDGGGLSSFDKTSNQFVNHTHSDGLTDSLNSNQVRTVYEDKQGDIWVGNYPDGINFFDRTEANIASYTKDSTNPYSLNHKTILSVQEDKLGNLWLGTDGGGLNYFDRNTGNFSHFTYSKQDPHSISSNSVLTTFIDSFGLIWVGTWGGGISSYNPVNQLFTRYPFENQKIPTERARESTKLNSPHVWSIQEDNNHDLWITTHTGGLSKFNRQSKTFTHFSHIDNDPSSLTTNIVWTTYRDSKGHLWVGTNSGLELMNEQDNSFTHFKHDPKDESTLSSSDIHDIFEDSKGRLWVGSDNGLNLYHAESNSFSHFGKKNGFFNNSIRCILENTDGTLWISTNDGFLSFNPDTNAVTNYSRISGRLVGAFPGRSGLISKQGEIIFGGFNGLRIFNPNKLHRNTTTPPVVFTDLKLFSDRVVIGGDDKILKNDINDTDTIVLSYKMPVFTLEFSALNFKAPSRSQYAYMMQGFDQQWNQSGAKRTATYTNLDAGQYIFHVKASNNEGMWNNEVKSITIIQLPPPWKTWWAYTIYVLFILAIMAAIVQAQITKRRRVEEQNRLLEMKVHERTAELREKNNDIQAMLKNMNQGLFTIERNGSIHPEYSHYLEKIFKESALSGKNAIKLLFAGSTLGNDAINQMTCAFAVIIGEDEINFTLNSHLLINEYETKIADKVKSLTLDWNPIVVDGNVVKLMVAVKDVTRLKKVESEAQSQKRELDLISQILKIPSQKLSAFFSSTDDLIRDSREHLLEKDKSRSALMAVLFRNMHTIKGNSRTLGFKYLSNAAHDAESFYDTLKSESVHLDKDQLLFHVTQVEDLLNEYRHVNFNVLARGDNHRHDSGLWVDKLAVDTLQQHIDSLTQEFESLVPTKSKQLMAPFQSFVKAALFIPIDELLSDVIASLPNIAVQLHKEPPKIELDTNTLCIHSASSTLLTNVFSHLLRNCIDHGIELPQVRVAHGKPASGSIAIRAQRQNDKVVFQIADDGQGMDIDKLFQRGVLLGHWTNDARPSYRQIAQLIFAPGVTTKEEVTDISGRGVGMDAVKQFLLAEGGDIRLSFLDDLADSNIIGSGVMLPFISIIELPQKCCM